MPQRIIQVDPVGLGADAFGVCKCDNGAQYIMKGADDALDEDMKERFGRELSLFERYSDELIDWQSAEGKKKLSYIIGHAVGLPEDGLFS